MAFSGHVIFRVLTALLAESAVFELEAMRFVSVVHVRESSDELLPLLLGFDDFTGPLLSLLLRFDDASGALPSLLMGLDDAQDVFFCCSLFLSFFSSFYSCFCAPVRSFQQRYLHKQVVVSLTWDRYCFWCYLIILFWLSDCSHCFLLLLSPLFY